MADHNDTHEGVFSGLAAGILIIALTIMAFFAFQPPHAASLRAAFEAATISS